MSRIRLFRLMGLGLVAGVLVAGCGQDPVSSTGGGDLARELSNGDSDLPTLIRLPADPPEDLLTQLVDIYNDDVSGAGARLSAYTALFPPADHRRLAPLRFHFQPSDVEDGSPVSWGLESELRSHENLFEAQDAGDIFSLSLDMQLAQPQPVRLEPGLGYRVMIDAFNIELRLLFSPNDGLQVSEAMSTFDLSTADERWYINDWSEVESVLAVDPTSWGDIKLGFSD